MTRQDVLMLKVAVSVLVDAIGEAVVHCEQCRGKVITSTFRCARCRYFIELQIKYGEIN